MKRPLDSSSLLIPSVLMLAFLVSAGLGIGFLFRRYVSLQTILRSSSCLLHSCTALAQSWHPALAEYQYRTRLSFNHSGTALNNFPALVRLTPAVVNYAHIKADCADLAFADANNTLLPHEVELCNPGGITPVWVKTAVSAGGFIWLYYGNPNAAEVDNNPQSVWSEYLLAYHFNTGKLVLDSSPNQLTPRVMGDPISGPEHGMVGPGQHWRREEDYLCMTAHAGRFPRGSGSFSMALHRDWTNIKNGTTQKCNTYYFPFIVRAKSVHYEPGNPWGYSSGFDFFWNYSDYTIPGGIQCGGTGWPGMEAREVDNFQVLAGTGGDSDLPNNPYPAHDNFYRPLGPSELKIAPETWAYMNLMWNEENGDFRFFVNGEQIFGPGSRDYRPWNAFGHLVGTGAGYPPYTNWAIGGNVFCSGGSGIVGSVDEVRFTDHALSSDWMAADGQSVTGRLFQHGAEEKKF